MKIKDKLHLTDDNYYIIVEIMNTRRDVLDYLEQYLDNLQFEWFDASDEVFEIVYKDGTTDYIDFNYDGHKIKKNNIKSILYSNPETYIVYGDYEINGYGVAHAK